MLARLKTGAAAGRASAHLRPLEQEATEMRKGTRVCLPFLLGIAKMLLVFQKKL